MQQADKLHNNNNNNKDKNMARKTIADLEAENEALKLKLENSGDTELLTQENTALLTQNELLVKAKEESDARLVDAINNMEKPLVVNGEVQAFGCKIFKGNEYTEDLKRRGITITSKFDIETLRAFINSDWSPSMVMDKFGLTKEDLQSYVYKLSKKELREVPIKLNFKRDIFGRQG